MNLNKYSILFSLIFLFTNIGAQDTNKNILDQKLNIHADNVTILEIFNEISNKIDVRFSYNPNLIKVNKRVSIHAVNRSADSIIKEILENQCYLKTRGKYIIIGKLTSSEYYPKNNGFMLAGYIIDDETMEGIPSVSIFTQSGKNALTDEAGRFTIKLEEKDNQVIQLRKSGYYSLSFDSNKKMNLDLEIKMTPEKFISVQLVKDSIQNITLSSIQPTNELHTLFPINKSIKTNQFNIKDSLVKPATFSLYPGISTYGNLSGNMNFHFALNFVGYNRSISGLEIAALSNINKKNSSGVQIAGLSNYTGGNVSGVQVGGIFNIAKGHVSGIQIGGISNHVNEAFDGVQIAGISNINLGDVKGTQIGGVMNMADTVIGIQISGIANKSDSLQGLQLSGITNYTKDINGVQIAGIYNHSIRGEGIQFSGIVNRAKYFKGSQIGLINIADSLDGVPIGLFNIIKNGYSRIKVNADETFPINLAYTSGVQYFHTTLFIGTQTNSWNDTTKFLTAGYGIGSSIILGKSLSMDIDLNSQYISQRNLTTKTSYKASLYTGIEFKIYKKLYLAGGATLNAWFVNKSLISDSAYEKLRPEYSFKHDYVNSNFAWRGWFGYNFGVRLAI